MIRRRKIRDSTVVVVGATSGTGRATALSLAASGARLVIAARTAADLEVVERECAALGAPTLAVVADIARPEDIERLASSAIARFGHIDTWINAAAVLVVGDLDEQSPADVEQIIAINVYGTAMASRAAWTIFRAQGSGVLINVSSLLAIMPNPVAATYVMTKFAILGLTLSLHAGTPRSSAIRACAVMPGPIDSPMFHRAANRSRRAIRAIPPAASPERVAAAVIRSVERPRRERTVGLTGALIVVGNHVVPRLTQWIVATYAARMIFRGTAPAPDGGSLEPGRVRGTTSGGWRRGRLRRRWGDAVGRRLARS